MHRTSESDSHLPFFIPPTLLLVCTQGHLGEESSDMKKVLGDGNSTLKARLSCSRKKALPAITVVVSVCVERSDSSTAYAVPLPCSERVLIVFGRTSCFHMTAWLFLPRRTCSG
ncbi:hypothetical protein B296_00016194 [Ensete ventricosum]|uniref:Uncharacterized protein n=1 Tax=Ensete ventricosum TaxID=4639 RepID=A0A427ACC1_ENSVE|nr:hypothetical protein B296_00016194 [Ensete ventricosum]